MKYSLISAKSEKISTDYRNFYAFTNFALIFAQPFKFWGTGANFPGDPIGKALNWEESVKRTLYGLANTLYNINTSGIGKTRNCVETRRPKGGVFSYNFEFSQLPRVLI
jgi:hypothetical protein